MSLKDKIRDAMPLLIGVPILAGSIYLGVSGIKDYKKIPPISSQGVELHQNENTDIQRKQLEDYAGRKIGLAFCGLVVGAVLCGAGLEDRGDGGTGFCG